jgi:catechol 2,3-dioxygenase-like lactoylglutathione lyase family enzyme
LLKRISHAAVRVTDMERSLAFYCGVLGLREKFRLARDDGSLRLVYLEIAERQFIELFPGAEGPYTMGKTSAWVHLCLEVADIQQTYRELTARGLVTRGEPVLGADGSWQLHATDPDGNQIEFQQFTPDSRQVTG